MVEIYRANYTQAEQLIQRSDSINIIYDNKEFLAKSLNNKCVQNWHTKAQHSVCTKYLFDALDIHNDLSTETTKTIYINLSELLFETGFTASGLEYLEKVTIQSKKEHNNFFIAWALIIEGLLLFDEEGIKKLEKAIEIGEKSDYKSIIAYANSNLGRLYDEGEDITFEKTHQTYTKGRIWFEKSGNTSLALDSYLKLARFFTSNEKTLDSALIYTKKIEYFSKKYNNHSIDYYIYEDYYTIFKAKKKYSKALEYKEKADIEWEKLFGVEINNSIANNDKRYRLKEKEVVFLQQEIALEKAKSSRNKLYIGIAVLGLTSILLWFVFQQRQKRKNQEIVSLKRGFQVKTLESLLEGEEKERLRIAKELHDGVNGDLSAIKYKLSTLVDSNTSEIEEAITMINTSCQQIRAISHDLMPPALATFNILEAVETFCENKNNVHSEIISFHSMGESVTLSKKVELTIFRIIQELVSNSLKHAKATEINVQISQREYIFQINVEDNGSGYNVTNLKNNGMGLKNIQSRVDYLKASIDIISNKKGSSCTIDINTNTINDN